MHLTRVRGHVHPSSHLSAPRISPLAPRTSNRPAEVLCALPWFFLEKRRPGLALPPGASMLTIGFKQTVVAFRECMRLKQTFLYLIFYFLMYVLLRSRACSGPPRTL